jgi:hypothetical protein
MTLLYQCSILQPAYRAMEDGGQSALAVISIIIVICALAFAGYILIRNNKNPTSEDQLSLGNFFFVSKDDANLAKRTQQGPLEGNEASKTAVLPSERTLTPLQISNFRIEPEKASPGELITIWFRATNLGSIQIQHEFTLKIDGRVFNARMISMLPGAVLHLSFKVAITEPGSYTADVNGVSGIFTIGQ